ncbi:MAG: Ig-like domain-containing protein, partial [Myxococcales bacterium]
MLRRLLLPLLFVVAACAEPAAPSPQPPEPPRDLTLVGRTPSSDPNVVVAGLAAAGTMVRIYAGACEGEPLGEGTAEAFATGLVVTAPLNATTALHADARVPGGPPSGCSGGVAFTHDGVAPPAPVPGAYSPPSPSSAARVELAGTGEARSSITLFGAPGCAGEPLGRADTDDSGAFRLAFAPARNAVTTASLRAADAAGNPSTCVALAPYRHDDQVPVAPRIETVTPAITNASAAPVVAGAAEAGATVTVHADAACAGAALGTGPADPSGAFRFAVQPPRNATTRLFAHATDEAGNRSACSPGHVTFVHDDVRPPKPVWTGVSPASPSRTSTSATL